MAKYLIVIRDKCLILMMRDYFTQELPWDDDKILEEVFYALVENFYSCFGNGLALCAS